MKAGIAEIKAEAARNCARSKQDIMDWLGRVIDGRESVTPEQLKAAEILNRMTGWNEPEKLDVAGSIHLSAEEKAEIASIFGSHNSLSACGHAQAGVRLSN